MIDTELLRILRCPIDGKMLQIVETSLVNELNGAIQRGEIRTRQDQRVTLLIESGLLGGDGRWLYPIRNGIPTLIADEAILLPVD
jgi:uncharacterized protein YbaR (Trm112 family)